ncbi:MAG: hypothetical protein ACTSR0_02740 [Candidatus Asgardarchaeia archaeon]
MALPPHYNRIKRDLESLIENGENVDKDIVIPAIFAHALVLAKIREKETIRVSQITVWLK